ncbi:MAG: hypothetical protein HY805_08465 [Nitrospirae bacterium]|nr:hypothetical protein [Nitrospirota bacterium]
MAKNITGAGSMFEQLIHTYIKDYNDLISLLHSTIERIGNLIILSSKKKLYSYESTPELNLFIDIQNAESDNRHLFKKLYSIITKESIEEYDDDWVGNLDSKIDFEGIVFRLREVGALICASNVPKRIGECFEEIKQCYAMGLYNAAIVFCFALIEACLNCDSTKGTKEDCIEKSKLPDELKRYAHDIRKERNKILHERVQWQQLEDIALSCIRATQEIVEYIFKETLQKDKKMP